MNTFSPTSLFVRHLYNDNPQSLNILIPIEMFNYSESIKKLHKTTTHPLKNKSEWINFNRWITTVQHRIRHNYDVNDPDLMIDPSDVQLYRKTWAVCFEVFMRRQLMQLYKTPSLHRKINFLGKKFNFLHDINAFSPVANLRPPPSIFCNPDDIRLECINIRYFAPLKFTEQFNSTPRLIQNEYQKLKWYTDKNAENLPPTFKCRPALLNEMDCKSILFDNIDCAKDELIAKVSYYLRPFRFVLPLNFLFDIFGGNQSNPAIELSFPNKANRLSFADYKILADTTERDFIESFSTKISYFLGDTVLITRRANVCLAGGSLACMLGITKEFNVMDLFIEYDEMTYEFMAFMKYYGNGPNFRYV